MKMDIPLVLERLGLNGQEYGNQARTYAQLVQSWRGTRDVPTEATMEAEWQAYLDEQAASTDDERVFDQEVAQQPVIQALLKLFATHLNVPVGTLQAELRRAFKR